MRKKWQKKLLGASFAPNFSACFQTRSREMTFFIVVTFRNYFMIMRVLLTAPHLSIQINAESAVRIAPMPTNEAEETSREEKVSACLLDCKYSECYHHNLMRNVTSREITTLWRVFPHYIGASSSSTATLHLAVTSFDYNSGETNFIRRLMRSELSF